MFGSLGPVDNTTLRERVYRALKQAILEGRFSPGETLPTRSLAEVLGTSVMPVRDAMLRLNAEGGVEGLPNRAAQSYHLFPIIEALWLKGGPLLRPFVKGSRVQTRLFEGHDSHARALEGLPRSDRGRAGN